MYVIKLNVELSRTNLKFIKIYTKNFSRGISVLLSLIYIVFHNFVYGVTIL